MASTQEYIEFVCNQISGVGDIRYKKMFGEYMVYLNDKPIFLVCDNTVFVKRLDCVSALLETAEIATPYNGAKPHFVLDIEDNKLSKAVAVEVEKVTAVPKPRKKKQT